MKRRNILAGRDMSKRKSKYWICNSCADKQGLKHRGGCGTMIMGLCGHCDRPDETALTPVVDFDDPKSGRKAWFD